MMIRFVAGRPLAIFLATVLVLAIGCKAEPPAAEPSPSSTETQSPQPAEL
jgi:hypothetical protein